MGRHAVRDGPHRRGAGQREPGLPDARARIRAQPVGAPPPAACPALPGCRLHGHPRQRPRPLSGPDRSRRARRRLGGAPRRGRGRRRRDAGRTRGEPGLRRPHQHPVHVGNDRGAQGRHPLAPQHPQQRLLLRRDPPLHGSGPGPCPRPLLPLLRDGHRQSRLYQPRRLHRRAGGELRRGGHPGRHSGGTVHVDLRRPRRCSSPS